MFIKVYLICIYVQWSSVPTAAPLAITAPMASNAPMATCASSFRRWSYPPKADVLPVKNHIFYQKRRGSQLRFTVYHYASKARKDKESISLRKRFKYAVGMRKRIKKLRAQVFYIHKKLEDCTRHLYFLTRIWRPSKPGPSSSDMTLQSLCAKNICCH